VEKYAMIRLMLIVFALVAGASLVAPLYAQVDIQVGPGHEHDRDHDRDRDRDRDRHEDRDHHDKPPIVIMPDRDRDNNRGSHEHGTEDRDK
jgi:Ni/Co efflux regulator RcnB